jgi:outer membrane protein TolC
MKRRRLLSQRSFRQRLTPKLFAAILVVCFAYSTSAVTLETVLQTTLEKNPVIQEAKSGLEQAAGQRLVLRSMIWPKVALAVPAGVQGGHRAGESGTKVFAFARGFFTQTLFDAAVPPSLRRGDVGVLIAQQELNVAIVGELHRARVAFYGALYNRSLQSIREEQRRRLEENVATQEDRYEAGLTDRTALTSATVQARELDSQIESARRAYAEARLQLAQTMGRNLSQNAILPEPEGDLKMAPVFLNVDSETSAALERRADLKLARLLIRAANEDQRIIEAGYYPTVTGEITGDYIPITGIHREGSTSRTQDFISSELRETAGYTWRVIDNGKVRGAALRASATREINELTCRKLEADVRRELEHIANSLKGIEGREKSLATASAAAQESATAVQQNLASGLGSPLEYRVTQNAFLETKSGLLNAIYQHNLAVAEWDRATGRYFQFSDDTAQNVH